VLAMGSCQVSDIQDLEGPEAYDTATIVVRFENGKDAVIDVCRKAAYGYDQRAEVLGQEGMLMSENLQPSSVRKFTREFVGQADMPFDFFMQRYKEAYVGETVAFIDALVHDEPAPCSGRDGMIALVMSMAAGKSAAEERWVDFGEIIREEMKCNGDSCNFASLLDKDGKLGNNWVRAALLSVERSPNSRFDLEELFDLLDTHGEGTLKAHEVEDMIRELNADDKVDAKKVYQDATDVVTVPDEITFEQFITSWQKNGFDLTEEDDSLKKKFTFNPHD